MSSAFLRPCLVIGGLAVAVIIPGCSSETPEEKIKRAVTDTSMSDADAVDLLAKAYFKEAEVSTTPLDDGKLQATLTVHGEEDIQFASTMMKIKKDDKDINKTMKRIELMMFNRNFARFIDKARQRNLGEVVVTLQTPTFSKGKVDAWVDTYRVRLPADKFNEFIKVQSLELEQQADAAEKIWTVELDQFHQFRYEK